MFDIPKAYELNIRRTRMERKKQIRILIHKSSNPSKNKIRYNGPLNVLIADNNQNPEQEDIIPNFHCIKQNTRVSSNHLQIYTPQYNEKNNSFIKSSGRKTPHKLDLLKSPTARRRAALRLIFNDPSGLKQQLRLTNDLEEYDDSISNDSDDNSLKGNSNSEMKLCEISSSKILSKKSKAIRSIQSDKFSFHKGMFNNIIRKSTNCINSYSNFTNLKQMSNNGINSLEDIKKSEKNNFKIHFVYNQNKTLKKYIYKMLKDFNNNTGKIQYPIVSKYYKSSQIRNYLGSYNVLKLNKISKKNPYRDIINPKQIIINKKSKRNRKK